MIISIDRNYDEIMEYANPALQVFSHNRYSVEFVRMFEEMEQDIMAQINSIEISDDEDKPNNTIKSQKIKISELDFDGENNGDDEVFRPFGKK